MEPRLDPDRQIAYARESLVAHLGELGRRFRAAREKLDVRGHIAANPLAAVGVAFAVGALLGLRGGRERDVEEDAGAGAGATLGRAALAGLAALGVRVAKELAMRGAADAARGWWERRQRESSESSEFRTSYEPGVEPFLDR